MCLSIILFLLYIFIYTLTPFSIKGLVFFQIRKIILTYALITVFIPFCCLCYGNDNYIMDPNIISPKSGCSVSSFLCFCEGFLMYSSRPLQFCSTMSVLPLTVILFFLLISFFYYKKFQSTDKHNIY